VDYRGNHPGEHKYLVGFTTERSLPEGRFPPTPRPKSAAPFTRQRGKNPPKSETNKRDRRTHRPGHFPLNEPRYDK